MVKALLLIILMSILSYFIITTVHELGHIVRGILSGFRFELFVVGPFGLKRNDQDKVTFYIEKNPSFWGGVGAVVPINESTRNFKTFASVIIAGPLTSLIFGILCLVANLLFFNLFLILLGTMSVAISITTLLPARTGFFYTDGGRWLRIRRQQKAQLIEMAIFNIIQSYFVNRSYSKLNFSEITLLVEDDDPRNQYLGHYYARCYYQEHGDSDNANRQKECMKSLKGKVPKSFTKLLAYK